MNRRRPEKIDERASKKCRPHIFGHILHHLIIPASAPHLTMLSPAPSVAGDSSASPYSFHMLVYRLKLFFDRLKRRQTNTDHNIIHVIAAIVLVLVCALVFGTVFMHRSIGASSHIPDVVLLEVRLRGARDYFHTHASCAGQGIL